MIETPIEINTHNFNGSWDLNKKRGDDTGPLLKMQGVPWAVRQVAALSSAHVNIKMFTDDEGLVHLEQEQCTPMHSNIERRIISGQWAHVNVEFWGEIKGYSKYRKFWDVEDEFLKEGWLEDGEGEEAGDIVFSHAESQDRGWVAEQVWAFAMVDGQRTYVRKIVCKKGEEVQRVRMIYEFRA